MFANSVLFVPTAGGTTDFTVSSAATGFMTPALAGMPSGTYKYRAESAGLTEWEIGEGVYTSGTGILTRATVLYNSSGTGSAAGQSGAGSKISFTVAPNVGVVQLVEDTLGIDQANSWSGGQQAQAQSNMGLAGMATKAVATAANIIANSGSDGLTTDQAWASIGLVDLGSKSGTVTLDFNTAIRFKMTLGGNVTLALPTNVKAGQVVELTVLQGAGGNTISYGSGWNFPDNITPVIATGAGAVALIMSILVGYSGTFVVGCGFKIT